MGNTRLRPDGVVPFVDASQEDVAEVNGPDAVVDLLEADGVLLQRVGQEDQALSEAEEHALDNAAHYSADNGPVKGISGGVRSWLTGMQDGSGPERTDLGVRGARMA